MTQTASPQLVCPHCQATNKFGSQFCESCGKALPLASGGPRVVSASSMPTTAAGAQALSEQLLKTTKRARNTLFAVGAIAMLLGTVLAVVTSKAPGADPGTLPIMIGIQVAIGAIFFGLGFWANKAPLPASVVGLVLYATLLGINIVSTMQAVAEAGPDARGGGIAGLGIGWLDILIVIFLARGIQAGIEHRKLVRSGSLG